MASVQFIVDILPLFRPGDIRCMQRQGVLLDDVSWMTSPSGNGDYSDHANARRVFNEIDSDSMPPDQAWSNDRKALYKSWMEGGFRP
jgi:hypothetical protein